jgi:hypothetical protein
MRKIVLIIITFFPIISMGQYFGVEASDSIISKNNVLKCIEFNLEDSIAFYAEYPNGYYWIYNKKGLVVERNAYSIGYMPHEFTVHFIYDNKDRNIMWLWHDTTVLGNISRVRFEQYDSLGNNYGYRDFSGTEKYSAAYDIKNYYKTYNPDPIEIVDSLISDSQKEFFHFIDINREDTIEHRIEYFTKNRVDSIITHYNEKNFSPLYKQKFYYHDSSALEMFITESYDNQGRIKSTYKTMYLITGLPIEKWYTSFYNGEKNVTHTRFVYQYNKKE